MTNRVIVFAGAALLVLGLFVPIVQLPIVGSVGIFGDGSNLFAYLLLLLAGLAAFMAYKEQTHDAIWPGGAAALLVLGLFAQFQIKISQMKSQLAESLEGNPFAGMATGMLEGIQLQWGWIVLVAAVAAIIIGSYKERQTVDYATNADQVAKLGSLILAVVGILWLFYQSGVFAGEEAAPQAFDPSVDAMEESSMFSGAAADAEDGMGAAERRYIAENLEVYDLTANYQNSMLDGRVPAVDFKVKNNGDRSLDTVEVTVVFYDADGNAIAEDTYHPVIVTSYDSDPPLRPGYIWQQERGRFWTAKSVPDEWQSGKATAKITDIEFSPEN